MEEVFCEQIVEDERHSRGVALRVLLLVLAIGVPAVIWFIPVLREYVFFFLVIVSITAVLFFWRRCFNEYEYIFTDGQLDVDRIFNRGSRKHLGTIQAHEIMLIAPATYQSYEKYFKTSYDINIDASNHIMKEDKDKIGKYYLLARKGDKTIKILFQPNSQMLSLLKKYAPHKVIMEGAPERPIQMG